MNNPDSVARLLATPPHCLDCQARPEILDNYIFLAKKELQLKKEKERLKPEILELIKNQTYDDIYLETSSLSKYNEDLIYSWICDTYGEDTVEKVTKKTLDWEKFQSLVNLGELDITLMPADCAKFTNSEKIIVNRPKRKNDTEGSATGV